VLSRSKSDDHFSWLIALALSPEQPASILRAVTLYQQLRSRQNCSGVKTRCVRKR